VALSKEQIEQISSELIESEKTCVSIVALTDRFKEVAYEDAYAVQLKTFETRPMSRLILPRIEPEIAFLLKSDLKGPGINAAQVLDATEGVLPAFEVIDSRFKDWKITVKDSIADNASAATMILGGKLTSIKDLDLRLIGLVLEKNGEVVSTGAGAAVLGNPAESVAWLANKLAEFDISLKKGEFVMSGSLVKAVPVEAGASFRATFDRLGSVSVRFE
jgi:2-keto-4-pentenoate hydratase